MQDYLHRILGFYATRAEAGSVFERLVECGVPRENLTLLEPGQGDPHAQATADSDDVLKEMFRQGAIGTALGTFAAAAGTAALAAANITLFIASPVLGTLTMLGWGASLGGLVGAVAGADTSKGDVCDLVKAALASNHVVLVAHTTTEAQTTRARKIIGESIAEPAAAAIV